jgi:uncharacterized membrane protein YraQ (UPF0718 family)
MQPNPSKPIEKTTLRLYLALVPGLIVAGLVAYKGRASLAAIERVWSSGTLSTRGGVVAFGGATGLATALERSTTYFFVIGPALAFGVFLAAAVRAFLPKDWFVRILTARTLRAQLTAGAAGAPLMLCSCCVAPVFSAVYERSARLGPSLAIMLASPSLNPAALILTGLLFTPKIAIARVLMGASVVSLGGIVIDRLFAGAAFGQVTDSYADQRIPRSWSEGAVALFRSLLHVLVHAIPALVLGVVGSTLLTQYIPKEIVSQPSLRGIAVIATASIAVPLALPTFFEIPLALGLLMVGGPAGAAAALLFAGPAINLASLLTLGNTTHWRVAASVATLIWAIAIAGGLLVGA